MSGPPHLSDQELQSGLVRAGVSKATVAAALKQTEAAAVQDICDAFLGVFWPNWTQCAPDLENPALSAYTQEIFREQDRCNARLFAMQTFLAQVGVRDFVLFDLVRPDARRMRKHLAVMVLMLRFCERKQAVIDAQSAAIDAAVAQAAELEEQKAQALQEVEEAEAAHAAMLENTAAQRAARVEVEAAVAALQPQWAGGSGMLAALEEGILASKRAFRELEMRQEELIHQREELRRLVVKDPAQLRDATRAVDANIEEAQRARNASGELAMRMRIVEQQAASDGQRLRECLQQAEAVLGEVAVKKALKNSLREASSELQAELARVSALNAELMKRQSELEARRALGATLRAESESNRASAQEKARAARSKEDADSIEQEKAAAANDAMEAELAEVMNKDAEYQALIEGKLRQVAQWEEAVAATHAKIRKQAAFYKEMALRASSESAEARAARDGAA